MGRLGGWVTLGETGSAEVGAAFSRALLGWVGGWVGEWVGHAMTKKREREGLTHPPTHLLPYLDVLGAG